MGKKGKRKAHQSQSTACCSSQACQNSSVDKDVLFACQRIFELVSFDTPILPTKQWEEHLKLRELVEKIRAKQKGLPLFENATHPRQDYISSFMKWFSENNGKAEQVIVDDFGEQGLGLRAVTDIKEGVLFATIPRQLMMSAETARGSELGPLIEQDNILRVMQNACLVIHVYCEKLKKDSFWKPYLDILPSTYSTTLYFSVEEMQLLKGSPAFGEALKLYRNIARQYAYLYQRINQFCPETAKLPLKNNFTFDGHRWAVSTVITRQNKIPSTTGEPTLALIPMWDLCNHCNGTITTGYDLVEDSCKSLCVKDFMAGEQVCIFYGERSNAELLVHNGFVFEENIHDRVVIQLGVSKSDSLYQMKDQLLTAIGMTASSNFYAVSCGEKPISPELIAFLRIFSMCEDELKEWLSCRSDEKASEMRKLFKIQSPACREETEAKCWQFLETRLSLLLAQYKTPDAEEQHKFLNTEAVSLHKRLCSQLIQAERKVLQNALKYASVLKNKVSLAGRNCETTSEKGLNGGETTTATESHGLDEATTAISHLGI
ncbi:actin-histidine N-methyltransferase-like [Montipora foliosa]|uniref:actin-histidine N-methyltransferase-like n=1 Tax=Montipora foliosa TaxID=591990 RepID=UPI0035F1AF3B